jgi:hypothetical protein
MHQRYEIIYLHSVNTYGDGKMRGSAMNQGTRFRCRILSGAAHYDALSSTPTARKLVSDMLMQEDKTEWLLECYRHA